MRRYSRGGAFFEVTMFVNKSHVISSIGLNLLVQFASGRFDAYELQASDINNALLNTPEGELQQQILDWFVTAERNVNSVITGYVAKYELTKVEIDNSPLPSIAADLMRYELSNNDADEGFLARKRSAMKQLEKIQSGTIAVKHLSPTRTNSMKTIKAGSSFDWDGY